MRALAPLTLALVCMVSACGPADPGPNAQDAAATQAQPPETFAVTVRALVPEGTGPVYLTGNLESLGPWRPDALLMTGEGEDRLAVVDAPAGQTFEFKFTLGSWEREGLGPSGMVMPNSRVTPDSDGEVAVWVSDFKKPVDAYLADPAGAGVLGTLIYWPGVASAHLDFERTVSVWLPPEYEAEPDRRFPVIYMTDGQNLFDPRIANTGVDWGVDEALVRLTEAGVIEAAIVVASWSTPARRWEYSPWHRGEDYARFLIEELMPRVNAEFRTLEGPANTTHVGSSMGGLISFHLVTRHPDVFGACGCVSTHFPLSEAVVERMFADAPQTEAPDEIPFIVRDIEGGLTAPAGVRLGFDYGTLGLDAEYGPTHEVVRTWLAAQGRIEGADFSIRAYEGADHNEASWRARLDDVFAFALAGRAPPPSAE